MPLAIDASLRYGLGVAGHAAAQAVAPPEQHAVQHAPLQGPAADADHEPRPAVDACGREAREGRLPLLRPEAEQRAPLLHGRRGRVLREGRGVRLPGLLALRGGAELREDVRHLEAGADGFGALLEPVVRLLGLLEREHAEGDRNAGLERRELEPRAASPATKSKCGVSPRITQPSATMQA